MTEQVEDTEVSKAYQSVVAIADMAEDAWNISHQHKMIQCLDIISQTKSKIKHKILLLEQDLKDYIAEKTLELKEIQEKKLTEKQIDAIIQTDEKRKSLQTEIACEKYAYEQVCSKCDVIVMYITCIRDAVRGSVYPVTE